MGRMVDSEMSSEDTERLTSEFKRVRSNTGQFVIKSRSPLSGSIGRESSTSSPTNTESVDVLIEKSSEVNGSQDEKIKLSFSDSTRCDSIISLRCYLISIMRCFCVTVNDRFRR